jgi:hypothetical protein
MLGTILVKGPDFRVITQIFRGFLLGHLRRRQRRRMHGAIGSSGTRLLTVRFRVTCEDGESAADEVSFAIA